MSKSKFGNSNLYMTTREFADLVVQALDEQNYFKNDDIAHPQDIAYAFTTVGETIGNAMSWAIKQEHQSSKKVNDTKVGMMQATNLRKNALPVDEEIAPNTEGGYGSSYSEWKFNK